MKYEHKYRVCYMIIKDGKWKTKTKTIVESDIPKWDERHEKDEIRILSMNII